MTARPRARSLGVTLGKLDPGPLNLITDVPGVTVGHRTLVSDDPVVRTGVTVVVPHQRDVFREKVVAAAHVINGFGKAIGLTQLIELGVIETPIVLTNTLAMGAAFDGLVSHAIASNPEIGRATTTVNPVALECNDGWLNDIQRRSVRPEHVLDAIRDASNECALGSVGAGTGMMLYGWKGGIGSSSRVIHARTRDLTIGVLVLANFGRANELVIAGVPMATVGSTPPATDGAGSCIAIVATDTPMSSRQLGRIARRVQSGLARTGTVVHHGSGEYVVALSTAQTVAHASEEQIVERREIAESALVMDSLFAAVSEATEEAVIDALFTATEVVGRDGHVGQAFPTDAAIALLRRG